MMIFRSQMFNRVTIIGVGLMGGSFGLALKKHNLAKEIVGVSSRQSSLMNAIKYKAIDTAQMDVIQAVRNSDLIVLASPVESIVKILATIGPHVRRGCLVTDVGSVKVDIVDAARKSLPTNEFFVGSHPLVGSEKQGVEHATAELYEKSVCIMTPTESTNQVAKEKIKHVWNKIGAEVKIMTPEEHDETFAYISHLPHLLAFGLMGAIPEKYLEYATQGFRDVTRISASSPQMWNDICLMNSKHLLMSLDSLIKEFSVLRKTILNRDDKVLIEYLSKSKQKRDAIPTSTPKD